MALITCGECSKEISDQAAACPSCGAPRKGSPKQQDAKPAKSSLGAVKWLIAIMFGIFVFNVATDYQDYSGSTSKAAQKTRTAEDKIKSQFHAWDGSHMALERKIKGLLRDPDSYEHIETRYSREGNTLKLYTKYRARNGFGGMAVSEVIATTTVDGENLTIVSGL